MKRPDEWNPVIDRLVAEALVRRIREDDLDCDQDDEDAVDDLTKALSYENDGYHIAERLPSHWMPNAPLVAVLDEASHIRHCLHRDATITWVKSNGICPRLAVGTAVTFMLHREKHHGQIASIDHAEARYVIFCEKLGHVREGNGRHGVYINFEDTEARRG